jgi:hypothetical protein
MYNLTLRRVRELLLLWKSSKYYLLVCVCACVRSYGYRGACACAQVHVDLRIQRATLLRHVVKSCVAPRSPNKFFDIIS